jgi:hypothetical protein
MTQAVSLFNSFCLCRIFSRLLPLFRTGTEALNVTLGLVVFSGFLPGIPVPPDSSLHSELEEWPSCCCLSCLAVLGEGRGGESDSLSLCHIGPGDSREK